MNLKIFDAEMQALEIHPGIPHSRQKLIWQRLQNLSGTVLFASREKADFLVIRGAVHDLLSVPEDDLHRTANILNSFKGEAVLIAADIHDDLLERFKAYINRKKVIIMPEDRNKNISVTDALRMIASVQIREGK